MASCVSHWFWCFLFILIPTVSLANNSTLLGLNGTASPTIKKDKIPLPVGILLTSIGNDDSDNFVIDTLNSTINEFNRLDGILDDYHLYARLHFDKTVSGTLASLYDLIYHGQPVPILWGPYLSGHAIPVSEVITRYNITQVTLANSETLRDRDKYPYLNQIYPSINYINQVRLHLLNLMGWKRCGIIFEDVNYWRTHMDDLLNLFDKEQITVLTSETVHSAGEAPKQQIESLKKHDVRIIIVASYSGVLANILCEAYEQGLNDPKIVWIIPRWITATILRSDHHDSWRCSADVLREMLEFSFNVELTRPLRNLSQIDLNGVAMGDDHIKHISTFVAISDRGGGDGARHILDNLLVILLALNSSIAELHQMKPPRKLENFNYRDPEMRDVILKHVRGVDFIGSSDRVQIDRDGSRDASGLRFTIIQVQDGEMVEVLYFEQGDQALTYTQKNDIQWRESKPIDGETKVFKQLAISTKLLFTIYAVVAVGIILAFGCLFVNIFYRNNQAIKLSSPTLNNLIVIGSICLFTCIILLGLDVSLVPRSTLPIICHIETVLLCGGISLSFGTLFVKTYRIYAIFTYAISKFKHINLPDSKLLIAVACIVSLDLVLITFWVVLDPFSVKVHQLKPQFDMDEPEKEIYIINEITYCESSYQLHFTIAMYATKGMLLVFGIFLAWSTKDIVVNELNDSRFIAFAIYVVAIAAVMTAPTLSVFSRDVNVYFAVIGLVISVINIVVLGLVFIPRIISLRRVLKGATLRLTTMKTGINSSEGGTHSTITKSESRSRSNVKRLSAKLTRMKRELNVLEKELEK